jgi:Cu(I)/Ag(I) efflux system protein CusF
MVRFRSLLAAAALVVSAAAAPWAISASAATVQLAQARPPIEGEVTRIQKDTGKVTIRHGPIPNLDMPGMQMVFNLSDPSMIDKLKPGSKITFTADRVNDTFTVMSIDSIK